MHKLVLFYNDQCPACQSFKPLFEEASTKYSKLNFDKLDINSNLETYVEHAEKQPKVTYVTKDDGSVDEVQMYDEQGSPILETKFVIPSVYVYANDQFVGGLDGSSPEEFIFLCETLENNA